MIEFMLQLTQNSSEQMGINQTDKRTKMNTWIKFTLFKKYPLEQKHIEIQGLTENVM